MHETHEYIIIGPKHQYATLINLKRANLGFVTAERDPSCRYDYLRESSPDRQTIEEETNRGIAVFFKNPQYIKKKRKQLECLRYRTLRVTQSYAFHTAVTRNVA